jgi:hypothetical protein
LEDGTERTESLTSIVCTSDDAVIQKYFIHICETILKIVGITPSLDSISSAVNHLIDLFQRLSTPPTRNIVGLFESYLP